MGSTEKYYENLIERQKKHKSPHSGLCISGKELERTVKALENYLVLSEDAIKKSEVDAKQHGTLYAGNVVRFHDSYIVDILPKLRTALKHDGEFCFISR